MIYIKNGPTWAVVIGGSSKHLLFKMGSVRWKSVFEVANSTTKTNSRQHVLRKIVLSTRILNVCQNCGVILCKQLRDELCGFSTTSVVCLGHPQPPSEEAQVSCGCPGVCHDVQGDIATKSQPLCVLLVLCWCRMLCKTLYARRTTTF